MSKYKFFGVLVVVLVVVAGLVSVVSGKLEEQEFLSRALLVEAKVEAARGNSASSSNATSTSSTTPGIRANDKLPDLKYKLFTGNVKSIGTNSFVLTIGRRKDVTVTLLPETKVYDRTWGVAARSSIVVGHKVSAYGVATEAVGTSTASLSARIVRDLDLPLRVRNDRGNATSTNNATTTRGQGGNNN